MSPATPPPAYPPASAPRKPLWRRFRVWLLLILGLVLVALLIGGGMLYHTPSWYQPIDPADPNVDIIADKAQFALTQLSNNHQNAPFIQTTWTISQKEINSLLAVRYAVAEAAPNTNRSSSAIYGPNVLFTPDTITFSARSPLAPGGDPHGGVISVVLIAKMISTGPVADPLAGPPANRVFITVHGIWVGSLPLPQWAVQKWIDSAFPALLANIKQALIAQNGPRKAESDYALIEDWLQHARQGEPFTPLDPKTKRRFPLLDFRVTAGQLTIILGPQLPPTPPH